MEGIAVGIWFFNHIDEHAMNHSQDLLNGVVLF